MHILLVDYLRQKLRNPALNTDMSALLSASTALFSSLIEELAIMITTESKREKLILSLYIISIFSFGLTICAFVVAGTSNAGFNIVLSSFLNMGFLLGAWYVIRNSKTPIAIGFLIGALCPLAFLNMMNGVYWGQLSHCTVGIVGLSQYTCTNPTAYGAVSVFSVLIFLLQSMLAFVIISWRGALINEEGMYHEDTSSSSATVGMLHTVPQRGVLSLDRGVLLYEGLSTTETASPPPSADL